MKGCSFSDLKKSIAVPEKDSVQLNDYEKLKNVQAHCKIVLIVQMVWIDIYGHT